MSVLGKRELGSFILAKKKHENLVMFISFGAVLPKAQVQLSAGATF